MTCCRLPQIRAIDRSLQKGLAVLCERKVNGRDRQLQYWLVLAGGLRFQMRVSTPSHHLGELLCFASGHREIGEPGQMPVSRPPSLLLAGHNTSQRSQRGHVKSQVKKKKNHGNWSLGWAWCTTVAESCQRPHQKTVKAMCTQLQKCPSNIWEVHQSQKDSSCYKR